MGKRMPAGSGREIGASWYQTIAHARSRFCISYGTFLLPCTPAVPSMLGSGTARSQRIPFGTLASSRMLLISAGIQDLLVPNVPLVEEQPRRCNTASYRHRLGIASGAAALIPRRAAKVPEVVCVTVTTGARVHRDP